MQISNRKVSYMANLAQPQTVINYISERKKICVNSHNQPSQLLIQTDYYLNETYNFQVINAINQIVQFDNETTYQIYGSYIDAKNQIHILFYTPNYVIRNNILSFTINTFTSEYLAYVKTNKTQINISIVAKKGNNSYMVLRDIALANPRAYLEGQAPTDIVYQNVFIANVPVSGSFGAGNNINLAQDPEGQETASFAFGEDLTTNNDNQFIIGYNNEPDATKAFIVANSGNIFTVDYEGNVEAGDLNVGAISATSITVSGEDLNQVIDDKVEYLSTSIDDKLSATEDWVSNTFETKESATQTFNELEQDISDISAFVSGLPTDIAFKADQVDLDEANQNINTVSGQVEYLSGAIDQHTSDIGDLNTAVGSKANQTDLEALSTTVESLSTSIGDVDSKVDSLSTLVVGDYATKTELGAVVDAIPSDADISGIASAVTESYGYITSADVPVYTGVSPISVDPSTYQISLEGEVGETYYAGTGIALDEETNTFSLTGTVLSGGNNIKIENNIVSITGDIGGTYTAGTGIGIDGNEISLTASVSDINGYDTLALKSELIDSEDVSGIVEDMSGAIINGLASISDIPTSAETYEAISGDIEAQITGKNYITSDALNGLASDEDLQYVSGVVSAQAEDITALKEVSGAVDYETVFDMLSSGDTDTLTITKDDQNEKIVFTAAGGGGGGDKTYHGTADGGIAVDNVNDTITISANFLSANALEGYATQVWVGEQGYLTEVPDTYALKTDVDTASGAAVEAATGWVDSQSYLTEVPNTVSAAAVDVATGWVNDQNYLTEVPNTYALKEDIPTNDAITGLAKDYVDTLNIATTYATKDELSSKANTADVYSKTVADQTFATKTDISDFATSANVSAIVTGYNYITSADIPVVSSYVASTNIAIEPAETPNTFNVAMTANIPTTVAELTDASDYALVENLPTSYISSSDVSGIVEDMSGAIINGLATESFVTTQGYITNADLVDYAQLSDLPSDYTTSGQVSSIVEGYNYINNINVIQQDTEFDENTQKLFFNEGFSLAQSEDYVRIDIDTNSIATQDDLSTKTTSAQVSSIIEGYGYITGIANNALLSDIPVSISAITLSAYNASTMQTEATQTSTLALASTDFVTWNDEIYINETKFDIPTDSEISGIASAVTQNYITVSGLATQEWVTEQGYSTSNLTAVSQLTNDVGFITGYEAGTGIAINNGVISATGGGGGGTTYTAGDYISLANDSIAVTGLPSQIEYISGVVSNLPTTDTTYQAGYGLALSTDNTFVLTAETGGGSADPTNQQTISTGFTYSSGLQVANNSYTPVDNVITLSAFTVPADSLDEGKLATFEEWVYTNSAVTGIALDASISANFIGDLPTSVTSGRYYVFVRRVYNTGTSIKQYMSFAYDFEIPSN